MEKILDIYWDNDLLGCLKQDRHGEIKFQYSKTWLQAPDAMHISFSLPLTDQVYKRKACSGFFAGILPEDSNRKLLARQLGISAHNDFSMLEKIGGECAGALVFIPHSEGLPSQVGQYRLLSDEDMVNLLDVLPSAPILAGQDDVRLSLAGVQDKFALRCNNEGRFSPLNGAPSTHIVKPDNTPFIDLVYNEAFCMRLAKAVGLYVTDVEVESIDGHEYLLVARYDRVFDNSDAIPERLHQEDFCQALNVLPTSKYQNEGGPSLKQCFDLIRNISNIPVIDLSKMLDAVIFNYLIDNHDAHGKNFSLLYRKQSSGEYSVSLAPLYDLVCTGFYPDLSKKMAMKIGREYKSTVIALRHFEKMADELGLAKNIVKERVKNLAQSIIDNAESASSFSSKAQPFAKHIIIHAKRVLGWFS